MEKEYSGTLTSDEKQESERKKEQGFKTLQISRITSIRKDQCCIQRIMITRPSHLICLTFLIYLERREPLEVLIAIISILMTVHFHLLWRSLITSS